MDVLTGKVRRGAVVAASVVLAVSACDSTSPPESTVVAVESQFRPMLTSDGGGDITLFGGLPRRDEAPYLGGARGSMLQHSFTREGGDFDCNVSPGGDRFVFASTRHSETPDIYMKSLLGTSVMQLTADPSSDVQPVFSPDGSRVAFASDRTGNWDLWIMNLDGQQPVQVTDSAMHELHPSWSPDGSKLVYCAQGPRSGQWELRMVAAEEHGVSTFVGYGLFPEWSPVDDRILFQRARRRGSRWFSIWTIELVDGEPRYPTEIASSSDHALVLPAWSRDGQRIAYTTVTNLPPIDPEFGMIYESSDIWVMDADGGARARLTDGHSVNIMPAWTPSGRVMFTSARSGSENIWSVMPTTGPPATASVTDAGANTPHPVRVKHTGPTVGNGS